MSAVLNALNGEVTANPATPEACVALELNAERLSCYDALFKIPEEVKPTLVSERQAAQEIKPEPTEPLSLKEKVSHAFSDRLFAVEHRMLKSEFVFIGQSLGACHKKVNWDVEYSWLSTCVFNARLLDFRKK